MVENIYLKKKGFVTCNENRNILFCLTQTKLRRDLNFLKYIKELSSQDELKYEFK